MRSPTIKLFSEQISEANAQRDDAISRLSIAQQEIANKDKETAMLRAQLAVQRTKNDI